ncbi:MAG: hypothetical protein WBF47_10125, partial [Xanthobacteraceae bacterium]
RTDPSDERLARGASIARCLRNAWSEMWAESRATAMLFDLRLNLAAFPLTSLRPAQHALFQVRHSAPRLRTSK